MKEYYSTPKFHMFSLRAVKEIVHNYTGNNRILMTSRLSEEGVAQIQNALKELPAQLFTPEDSKYIIIDSGCSCTATGDMTDLIPSTVQVLQQPKPMDGIGGTLNATHKGQFLYEFLADDGTIQKLQGECVYVPGLPCRLFSPQDYFKEKHIAGLKGFSYNLIWSGSSLQLGPNISVTLPHDNTTRLPKL